MRVWLDDIRDPAKFGCAGYVWVYTAQEAIDLLAKGGVTHISLDHDLGDESVTGNGYDVAKYIEFQAHEGTLEPLEWSIHSANSVGRKNMEAALRNADMFWAAR